MNNIFGKNNGTINVNGKSYTCSGKNINIHNGTVIVDGQVLHEDPFGNIEIVIHGDVEHLDCDGHVEIHGNCGTVKGNNVAIEGDAKGDVKGNIVNCTNVFGNIKANIANRF